MASTTLFISLILFEFMVISSLGYARYIHHSIPSATKVISSKKEEEKLTRSTNLLPEDDIDIFKNNSLVEKEFKFPVLPAIYASIDDLTRHVGYIKLRHTTDARMFYYFFESRNSKEDPVVIWLTGGPGGNSAISIFNGNGPFRIEEYNLSSLHLKWNIYGWDMVSNIIYVDQPIGTGLSYPFNDNDIRQDQNGISNDLYDFLQEFFKKYPDFVNNDFFITGQSYAGHYAPALASRIQRGNRENEGIHINLKGFAVGNGLIDLKIQYPSLPYYAWSEGKITYDQYMQLNELNQQCESDTETCRHVVSGGENSFIDIFLAFIEVIESTGNDTACLDAFESCDLIYQRTLGSGNFDSKDIRKDRGASNNYSTLARLMNAQPIKDALGVSDIEFVLLSGPVYNALKGDWAKNLEAGIPTLLEDGIKVLIYAGDKDFICNWLGNFRWLMSMEWNGQQEFIHSKKIKFEVDRSDSGLMTSHGPLTFIKVYDSGINVPGDQPKVALHMIKHWMKGEL
ncbi:serine carboxypeptidase-like [Tripterygium wilfordii]|uniref:serine carboxypeptidase-like n=1 Tax=Tripterygium wilfordii TaxID=458696 RepID=UPI0018F83F40|nr:serine carboxypeptidase-like [Tripterygium wilfordii]